MEADDRKTLALERAFETVTRQPGWTDYIDLLLSEQGTRERMLLEGRADSYEEYLSLRGEWRGLQRARLVMDEVFEDAERIRSEMEENE